MFYTVKLMIDHLMLFHDNRRHAENIICGIDSCMFRSATVIGYGLHVRRNHPDDWSRQGYKRLIHCSPKTATPKNFVNEDCGTDDGEQEDVENVGEQFSMVSADYHYKLQHKLAAVVLKHCEVSLIPKSVMVGIVKDMQDILQYSQLAVVTYLSENSASRSFASGQDDDDGILTNSILSENEIFMDDIFKCVTSAKQLKAQC
jgi:hypothetical protein